MPANIVKSVSNKCDMSMSEVEKLWDDAKKEAEDQDHKDDFDYITSIFKNMVGKPCMKKMGWTTNERLLNKINKYLNEGNKEFSEDIIDKVRKLVDRNNHIEARILIAEEIKNKKMLNAYKGLKSIQDHFGYSPQELIKVENMLNKQQDKFIKQNYDNSKKIINTL